MGWERRPDSQVLWCPGGEGRTQVEKEEEGGKGGGGGEDKQ